MDYNILIANIKKYEEMYDETPIFINVTEEQQEYINKEIEKAIKGERGVITFAEVMGDTESADY